jgi:ABC-type polysaccharide/polyol phosphate transport system ATPase subunit
MSSIYVKDLSIKFRIYRDRTPSIKDYFVNFFKPKTHSSFSDFWAIKNITINLNPGDRVGIIGHNGAGKSTLLKTLCRIYEPSEGGVAVTGRIVPLLEIGAGFHPEFTGRENIYLNGAIFGYSKKQLQNIESEVISFAEVDDFIDTQVKYYSTGMYMRLAFSLATAMKPDILVLDEVFAGGDAAFLEKAKPRLSALIETASIMVMVSHDHTLIESLCNRVIWLDHGKMIADGSPKEIINCYLGKSSTVPLTQT